MDVQPQGQQAERFSAYYGLLDGHLRRTHECCRLECGDSLRHASTSERVIHGDHVDFLVDGRLHHVHDGHCDDHGTLLLA